MNTVSLKTNLNFGKKEISTGEFFEKFLDNIENLEDLILGNMINESKNSENISKKDVFNFLDSKIKG